MLYLPGRASVARFSCGIGGGRTVLTPCETGMQGIACQHAFFHIDGLQHLLSVSCRGTVQMTGQQIESDEGQDIGHEFTDNVDRRGCEQGNETFEHTGDQRSADTRENVLAPLLRAG